MIVRTIKNVVIGMWVFVTTLIATGAIVDRLASRGGVTWEHDVAVTGYLAVGTIIGMWPIVAAALGAVFSGAAPSHKETP